MKKIMVVMSLPMMIFSSFIVIGALALIKSIEEKHDDEYFWE